METVVASPSNCSKTSRSLEVKRLFYGGAFDGDFVASISGLLIAGCCFCSQDHSMPHKFNSDRRHKIAKQKFQITNWSRYNESLRQCGDLTVWVSDEALYLWSASRRISRGGQPKYSDLAITLSLTIIFGCKHTLKAAGY